MGPEAGGGAGLGGSRVVGRRGVGGGRGHLRLRRGRGGGGRGRPGGARRIGLALQFGGETAAGEGQGRHEDEEREARPARESHAGIMPYGRWGSGAGPRPPTGPPSPASWPPVSSGPG